MFSDVVELYRASGRPTLVGGRFSYIGRTDPRLEQAVLACEGVALELGHFSDGPDRDGDQIDFTWALASNESGRFYGSIADFIARCESIHRGEFPEQFYLTNDNYLSTEPRPDAVKRLEAIEHICELIRLLDGLSVSGNLAKVPGRPAHLLFVKPASASEPPITVEMTTRIEESMLGCELDLKLLRDLLGNQARGKVRTEEYKAVFRLAIAGVCAEEPAETRFEVLLRKWSAVLQRFQYDVECLVDRLSFEALRQEMVDVEVAFVDRINTGMVENATKFLGIPVSLVAISAVASGPSLVDDILVCLGSVIFALVISGLSKANRLQLETTTIVFRAALERMRGRAGVSGEVASKLDSLSIKFDARRQFATRVIWTFHVLAWLPPLLALAIIVWKFAPLSTVGLLGLH